MTVRIAIDPNVRVRGNQTVATFEDIRGADSLPKPGDQVLALWDEVGLVADATVTDVAEVPKLVYLAVDWQGWRDDPEAADDPACE